LEVGSKLLDWSMEWTDTEDALALGNINLLNHDENPNCRIENDFENMTKSVYSKRFINIDEELTIDYDCPLWF
jgi:SET domain-containing protein